MFALFIPPTPTLHSLFSHSLRTSSPHQSQFTCHKHSYRSRLSRIPLRKSSPLISCSYSPSPDVQFPPKVDRKMIVVDLQQVLRNEDLAKPSDTTDHERKKGIEEFCERVNLERKSSKLPIFLLFTSSSNYDASIKSIEDGNLIRPDALVTLNGTELYQNGYKTPDPYWTSQISSGWTPKPIEWVINKFYPDEIDKVHINDDQQEGIMLQTITLKFNRKKPPAFDFCSKLTLKLKEMGISARVVLTNDLEDTTSQDEKDSYDAIIIPAASSPAHVVQFCQMMLGIQEKFTFVFGDDDLINDCVQGKSNVGLCPTSTDQQWDAFDDRVYISEKYGIKALMDGLYHYAVF